MSQNNAPGAKTGETKKEENAAAAAAAFSSTNSKNIQLDIQSIRLVSDTLKVKYYMHLQPNDSNN